MKHKPQTSNENEAASYTITAKGNTWHLTQHFINRFHERITDPRIRTIRYITQFFAESYEVERIKSTNLDDHLSDNTILFYNNGCLIISEGFTVLTCYPYPFNKLIII